MALELLGSLALPGDAARPCEDAFGHDALAAVVMDGATPLGDSVMPGKSDAAWIAQFGARRLLAHLRDGGARKALRNALADAEKSFHALRLRELTEKWQTPCASMILAAQVDEGLEFLWFGDCAALLKQDDATVTLVGDVFDKKAKESGAARQLAAAGDKPATERRHFLAALRQRRNVINSGDNWLFSPDPAAAGHVRRRVATARPGAVLLLASDGFLALASDYGAYNADSLMQAAIERGLDALGEELRAIETNDALGERFPRFKTSDDATALLLKLT